MAEGSVRASAIGHYPEHCLEQAFSKAHAYSYQAIADCNKSSSSKNCQIAGHRITQYPTMIRPIQGHGKIDEYRISEQECRSRAIRDADKSAIDKCQSELGTRCALSRPATNASYRQERRRRYIIFGPKEDFQICAATAEALPMDRAQYRCEVELYARDRF